MAKINMKYMPSPNTEYTVNLDRLDGGLNINDLPFRLKNNESPHMMNLMWRDGVLCSRDGQEWVIGTPERSRGMYNYLYQVGDVVPPYSSIVNPVPPPDTPEPPTVTPSEAAPTPCVVPAGTVVTFKCMKAAPHEDEEDTNAFIYYSDNQGETWLIGDSYTVERSVELWVYSAYHVGRGSDMYRTLFHDYLVAVRSIDATPGLYCAKMKDNSGNWIDSPTWTLLTNGTGTPTGFYSTPSGCFFRFGDDLYYKSKGGYYKITFNSVDSTLSAAPVVGYTPVTVLNADPGSGSGDLYQPENRIQSAKTIRYTVPESNPPATYYLPVTNVDSVVSVKVNGTPKTAGTDYTVNLTNGTVTFSSAPQPTNPPTNNTVEITYSKANTDAMNSIMTCKYAETYGGTGELCVVMGGCTAQPNAIFWSGNNIAMDPTYFPFDQYQLVGDSNDPVTGFGKQQSFLVVFQEHSVGRVKQDLVEVDGRVMIDMPYVAINDKIGCDCPKSIQLIENNLVWANREQGIHILKDSSYAYENNIECISLKINGVYDDPGRQGLLKALKKGFITSNDDGHKYWVEDYQEGLVWVWDYEHTSYKDPSWYPWNNIHAMSYASALDIAEGVDKVWALDHYGGLSRFTRNFSDFYAPIEKSYRFATQFFGGYDRLKNVNSVIICVRPDTNNNSTLTYMTDYETRKDRTNLLRLLWQLVPRNLTFRSLDPGNFLGTWVFRRRPMCRRVKHFTMQLDNNVAGQDLSIVSAQIFYNYQGRFR